MKESSELLGLIGPSKVPQHQDGSDGAHQDFQIAMSTAGALLRTLVRIEEKVDRLQKDLRALKDGSDDSEYVTVAEAARILRRSPFTIRRWLREGKLDGSKTIDGSKGQYLIRRKEVDSLLQEVGHHG